VFARTAGGAPVGPPAPSSRDRSDA